MFIEIHDRETKKPTLVNVEHISLIAPDRDKEHCLILYKGFTKWSRLDESYEEVCAMIGGYKKVPDKKLELIVDMLKEGRITNNEARILDGLNPVIEIQE